LLEPPCSKLGAELVFPEQPSTNTAVTPIATE